MHAQLQRALTEGIHVKVPSLARALDMSRAGLYDAIKRGDVEAVRIGRTIRVPALEARRLLGLDQEAA